MAENMNPNVKSEQEESRVISTIQNMFGDKVALDVICAVVENCDANLESSVNAILSILQVDTAQPEPVATERKLMSSIVASSQSPTSDKDIPKKVQDSVKKKPQMKMCTPQTKHILKISAGCERELDKILAHHYAGYRTLIIMRGLPGSGKSFVSRHIIDITVGPTEKNYKAHIFSTDDFFVMKGFYNVQLIDEAHKWNHHRVEAAIKRGLSPVIVDNTNTELWEMEFYVRAGVKEGYYIMVLVPKTPWSGNIKQLAKRNVHGVSEQKLSKMALRYQSTRRESIVQEFGLSYPSNKVPPVLRIIPPLLSAVEHETENQQNCVLYSSEAVNPTDTTVSSANIYLNSTGPIPDSSSCTAVFNQECNVFHTNQINDSDDSVAGITSQMSKINETPADKISEDSQVGNLINFEIYTNVSRISEPLPVVNSSDQSAQSNIVDSLFSSSLDTTNSSRHLSEDLLSSQIDENSNTTPTAVPISTVHRGNQNVEITTVHSRLGVGITDQNTATRVFDVNECNELADDQHEEDTDEKIRLAHIANAEKKIEELKKLEDEWEMGGDWVEVDNRGNASEVMVSQSEPKPQRKRDASPSSNSGTLMPIIENTQDWQDIARFMPPWNLDSKETVNKSEEYGMSVEMSSRGTSIEFEDWDVCNSKYKIISTFDRDINFYYMPNDEFKSLKKVKFDKSTQVKEDMLYKAYRCKNEEKHFKALCKIFKNISKSNLREIFDKCHSDTHWTIDLLLESGNQPILNAEDTSNSDTESEDDYDCDCFKVASSESQETEFIPQFENIQKINRNVSSASSQSTKQHKGKTPLTKSALKLKKELEQNVKISDDHYSEHCLNLRKMRRGESLNLPGTSSQVDCYHSVQDSSNLPPGYIESLNYNNYDDDDQDVECPNTEDIEAVNVNVGKDFIVNLDKLFNRKILYSENIMPVVNMPVSLLNQINALWLESYAHQIDSQATYSDILVNEDQELARQLAEKEAELAREGKKPEVPNFKEIMDMDMAIAVYQKDVAEWKNNKPNDLAAKMTRDKLCNLFPELPSETLVEVLMAHENNFQATVETMLMSTGQAAVLQEENGLNKFVMNKEMEQRKIFEEQRRQALDEEEFPLLTKIDPDVAMSKAEQSRAEAMDHLERRNMTHGKAQDFIRRGMTQVGSYYSDVARFHKEQFERFNQFAATYFIQSHAASRDKATMDLHFLFVPEAMQALDLFLDHHIMLLRKRATSSNRHRPSIVFLITGRGVHSRAGPKIKPAAKKRLRQRGVSWYEVNPGLLCVFLTADDLMTHQIFP